MLKTYAIISVTKKDKGAVKYMLVSTGEQILEMLVIGGVIFAAAAILIIIILIRKRKTDDEDIIEEPEMDVTPDEATVSTTRNAEKAALETEDEHASDFTISKETRITGDDEE